MKKDGTMRGRKRVPQRALSPSPRERARDLDREMDRFLALPYT
jgi:hypothetical protein